MGVSRVLDTFWKVVLGELWRVEFWDIGRIFEGIGVILGEFWHFLGEELGVIQGKIQGIVI